MLSETLKWSRPACHRGCHLHRKPQLSCKICRRVTYPCPFTSCNQGSESCVTLFHRSVRKYYTIVEFSFWDLFQSKTGPETLF